MELFKEKTKLSIFVIFISLVFPGNIFAEEESGKNSFSGFIMVGGLYSTGKMALNDAFDSKNKKIGSLSESSKNFYATAPIITGSLSYTIASTGTTVSLGGEGEDFGLSLFQYGGNFGSFTAGASMSEEEVFKDPFITGAKRDKTVAQQFNFNFSWVNIFNRNLSASYSLTTHDPDNDLSGKRNKKLKRDGNIHTFGLGFDVYDKGSNKISVSVSYDFGDISGESYAFKGPGAQISHAFSREKWELETAMVFAVHDFDSVHPEFNKTRHEVIGSIGTTYTLNRPFDLENWFFKTHICFCETYSNIDFYDSSAVITFFGVGYGF
ncbi:MAG: DUF2860 family protein [Desulfobacteraceae bacterium]|nr:DUF2860 family protein [Desulfobacteraceae bacterium]